MTRKRKSKSSLGSPTEIASLASSHGSNVEDSQISTSIPKSPKSVTRNGSASTEKQPVELLAAMPASQKWKNFTVRAIWTLVMIFGFFAILAAGQVWVIMMIIVIQTLVYKEVIALAQVPAKEKKLKSYNSLNWYFLFSTNYFLYGESMIYYFKHIVFVDNLLLPIALHHRFISFILYMIGFMFFVANLKKGHYRFQFAQFCWTHMTLLLVVCSSHFLIDVIFEGLIWFFLPAALVVANDIWAYICGFIWGKTPLIKLSPKKTVEGFVGAWICTLFFALLFSSFLMRWGYMTCPIKDFGATAWSGVQCETVPAFVSHVYSLPPYFATVLQNLHINWTTIRIAPVQLHALVLACFASLIAPFGGFFASGFKRAFNIKDFGDSIPGHGGLTDRMDCQFMMGVFTYMYYQSFVKTHHVTVGSVLETAISSLTLDEQVELVKDLHRYLLGQGRFNESVLKSLKL